MATMLSSLPGTASSSVVAKQECLRSCPVNAARFGCSTLKAHQQQRVAVGVRCEAGSPKVGFLGRLGRVIKEKAKSDIQLLFSGFSKTRENLAVVDELLTYWNLDESENILDELEEVWLLSLRIGASFNCAFFNEKPTVQF